MKQRIFRRQKTYTPFIKLDTGKCKACWKCIEECKKQVIGKVVVLWHKHVLIVQPDACSGCLKCVKICPYNAYLLSDGTN